MTPMRVIRLAAFLAVPVAAQWINLPTPSVPRTPGNKVDVSAPAPRTSGAKPSAKPDFSGMWIPRDVLTCDPKERGVQCTELPLTPQVIHFAAGLKDGLPYQPWAADLVKSRAKDVAFIDPHVHCMPPNFPRAWAFPETEDMLPTWNGSSIAHWDGDTLVVESAGYRDDSWLDTSGNFFSSEARVTERIQRPSFGSLDIDVSR